MTKPMIASDDMIERAIAVAHQCGFVPGRSLVRAMLEAAALPSRDNVLEEAAQIADADAKQAQHQIDKNNDYMKQTGIDDESCNNLCRHRKCCSQNIATAIRDLKLKPAQPQGRDDVLEEAAKWMIAHSYATGHGDCITDLLGELEGQAVARALKSKPAQPQPVLSGDEAAAFESLKRWRDGGDVSITYNAGDTAFATHVIAILAIIDRLTGAKS